jgi:hypothetical protein
MTRVQEVTKAIKAIKESNHQQIEMLKAHLEMQEFGFQMQLAAAKAEDEANRKPTADHVAQTWKADALKAVAKKMGLSTSGTEKVVAQRLIDSGWSPKE